MDEELKKELKDIKGLLALVALLEGASSKDIASVLGVTSRTVTNMLPVGSIKKGGSKDR